MIVVAMSDKLRQRSRCQFSLRSLLLVTTTAGVACVALPPTVSTMKDVIAKLFPPRPRVVVLTDGLGTGTMSTKEIEDWIRTYYMTAKESDRTVIEFLPLE